MACIDRTGTGIATVVDEDGRLLGVVTDGDIRRAILGGRDLDEQVDSIMTRSPVTIGPTTDTQEIRRLLVDQRLRQIPVVDDSGRLVDLVLVSDLVELPLCSPDITSREIDAVLRVLTSGHLSLGPAVPEFESRLAAASGRAFAVAVNSGTSGLHLVVRSLNLTEGDEVITTPFSFIASSNCLLYERVRPVFVDIEPDTLNLDPTLVEAAITPRTKAILAVDVFGQPARYDVLSDIAERHKLHLISDCCESIGAEYKGRRASEFGIAGVFGFYPNKQVTTAEGGAIITDNADIARLCRSMRNQGRSERGGWLMHERLGFNYRLSDLHAALGVAQLDRLDDILRRRQALADVYGDLLRNVNSIELPYVAPEVTRMSWFVYVIRLKPPFRRQDRDRLVQRMALRGIAANTYFQPIHLQPFYRSCFGYAEGAFPIGESAAERTVALPFFNELQPEDAARVASVLAEEIERCKP
jgi:perosamine synthetase